MNGMPNASVLCDPQNITAMRSRSESFCWRVQHARHKEGSCRGSANMKLTYPRRERSMAPFVEAWRRSKNIGLKPMSDIPHGTPIKS